MRLITLLNHCQHFPGFVYEKARLSPESSTIEIHVRPRRGSKPVCSGCHKPAAGYDQLSIRRFEFVPFWGFMVLLLYRMRRVDCRACGVRVEELPWAIGKHQLTKAYMLFLAHWARKLSWQETAVAFRSTWDKVCQAVEYVVEWGLEHRNLGPIQAIGVDEIQYAKGHKYLTLVYQIEKDCTRLLWIGKDRTIESFERFFTLIGEPLSESIKFVCSDMWQISPPCNASGCATCYATTSRQCEPICSRKTSSNFGNTTHRPGPPNSSMIGASKSCARASSR